MTDVQVKIELGHRAAPRAKPTKENFTHDWTVYVRGPEQYNIAHFVEKVVFHLHPSFENPKRVCKEPPYHVTEKGYAGFELPIEIYFKNKAEPRKIKLTYNLFLHLEEPVTHSRCEKLTFQNPTEEFKKKLLKAGGVLMRPAEEAQFQNLFGPPIKTTESPKKQNTSSTPSKERPSRLSLDENLKHSNSKSKDKDISTKSTSLTATANTSGRSESARRDESHVNKEKHSKERHLSKDSASFSKQADSPIPNPFSTSKRLSESPHRNEQSSKKLKRSSSFSDKKTKDKDRETEKEKNKSKENEKELEKDKECEREKDREREKDKQREREKEKEHEKEKMRLKEYEREKEKEREKLKEIYKEKVRLKEKQRQKEKTDHNTEKQKDKSHKNSHGHRKNVHNDKDNEKEKLKELKQNRSSSIDSNYKNKSSFIVDEKQKQARDNKSNSPPELPNSDNQKRSSVKHEKASHKDKSHKEKRHIQVENTSQKEVKQDEKLGENKTVCETEIKVKPSEKSNKIKKVVSSIHNHKPLSKITSRELIDDLSLSDSSDSSSDVSSLTSSSSSSGSDSDSNSDGDDRKSNSPKSHDSSSKASTPVTKSALGTLIAELEEDDSDEEIAAPSSMFSNHSMSSKPSPNKNEKLFAAEPKYQPSPSPRKSEVKRLSPEIRQDINDESKLSQSNPRSVVSSSPKTKSKGSTSERTPVKNETVVVKSERRVSNVEYFEDVDKCKSNGVKEDTSGIYVGDQAPEELNESVNKDLTELIALQEKLMSIRNPEILVKVVLLIKDLGKYKIGESTFDFDLCSLDKETIQQIQTFISEN